MKVNVLTEHIRVHLLQIVSNLTLWVSRVYLIPFIEFSLKYPGPSSAPERDRRINGNTVVFSRVGRKGAMHDFFGMST